MYWPIIGSSCCCIFSLTKTICTSLSHQRVFSWQLHGQMIQHNLVTPWNYKSLWYNYIPHSNYKYMIVTQCVLCFSCPEACCIQGVVGDGSVEGKGGWINSRLFLRHKFFTMDWWVRERVKKMSFICYITPVAARMGWQTLIMTTWVIYHIAGAGFLIRSYGTPNGTGRCSVAQCHDKIWATLVQQ